MKGLGYFWIGLFGFSFCQALRWSLDHWVFWIPALVAIVAGTIMEVANEDRR